jgi:hypothetical protein
MHRRTLWESTDELVQEFLGAYLQMESVAAVFDANIEELCVGELCDEWSGVAHRTLSASKATFWLRWLT